MVKNNNKKGFTIIEVVLVLAIAGLIFLMVFIALPALQRSQRNTQRQNDISRFVTSVNDFKVNNGNQTPFQTTALNTNLNSTSSTAINGNNAKQFGRDYIVKYIMGGNANDASKFTDPNGTTYQFMIRDHANTADITLTQVANPTQNTQVSQNVNNTIYVYRHSSCSGREGVLVHRNGAGDYAMVYVMEGGAIYCNGN